MKDESRSEKKCSMLIKMCSLSNDVKQMFEGWDWESVARTFRTWWYLLGNFLREFPWYFNAISSNKSSKQIVVYFGILRPASIFRYQSHVDLAQKSWHHWLSIQHVTSQSFRDQFLNRWIFDRVIGLDKCSIYVLRFQIELKISVRYC